MHALRCVAECCRTLQLILNLGFLGWEGTNLPGKLLWWFLALSIPYIASRALLCSHTYWGPAPSCKEGDRLFYTYFMIGAIMRLLGHSRQVEVDRGDIGIHPVLTECQSQ